MAFVFGRRLALPLWALAFFAVALTAPPPTTLFLMVLVVLAIALMAFTVSRLAPSLRTSRPVVQVLPDGSRHKRHRPIDVAAAGRVRTLDGPKTSSAEI